MLNRNILFFVFLILITSCTTFRPVSIDVLQPAKYSFPPEIKSVVLVDNSIPYRSDKMHTITVQGKSHKVDTIWADDFALSTLKGMKKELDYRAFFDSVYIHPSPVKTNPKLVNRALSWIQVDSLCKAYNAEAVVAVERNIYKTKLLVDNLPDGYLYGYLDASGAILWRGYNNLNNEQIYQSVQKDTISWDAYSSSVNNIAAKIPPLLSGINELAGYMGAKATDDVAPRWQLQTRGYYISGNYQFMQANEFVRKDQYGDAIKLWKYAFDHTEKKLKYRAAYNLAFVSEIMGDYESAVYWIQEGAKELGKYKSNVAKEDRSRYISYINYLKDRLSDMDALKIQVGGIQ
ncbi:DUF6340 family protein [Labilibacter marinus]|uniref:DUF6340 family protein n=1 Tax=Labilibacter marinus TaxID=1477105 RepID=UPI00094F6F0C|nr:DUF6340 family protein [Labilibacter marinus]